MGHIFFDNTYMTTRKLEFQSRNINILNDLLHESCRVMGFEDFKFKSTFDLNINFVDFYSLTYCLPRSWRRDIDQINIPSTSYYWVNKHYTHSTDPVKSSVLYTMYCVLFTMALIPVSLNWVIKLNANTFKMQNITGYQKKHIKRRIQ